MLDYNLTMLDLVCFEAGNYILTQPKTVDALTEAPDFQYDLAQT